MSNGHNHTHPHDSAGNIRLAFFLNLLFTLLEIVGGLWTNSLAILADALHDLGDSFSLGLSWYLEKYAQRGVDSRYSYGYRRFSLLAALLNTAILLTGGVLVLSQAIPRLFNPQHSNAQGMVLFAVVGIAVNGLAALRLRRDNGLSSQVVAWHLLEDVLGWAAVLVVSVVMLFWDIHILDPLLSIGITLYVLWNVLRNLRRVLALFLQAVPENFDVADIERQLLTMENVQSVHHTHLWSLDGQNHVLTTHIVVDECTSREQILQLKRAINSLTAELDFSHTTLEIEYEDEDCRMKEMGP
ncbi:MAG TPA: cation diffusion facilitator family transporter [Anaerolineales bacterium]|nr:cation diffusion facilitator family transporter [Anaerolineales bacterium]